MADVSLRQPGGRLLSPDEASAPIGRSDLIEGLGCVQLEVADLERSLAFYRDGLRFRCNERAVHSTPTVHLLAGDLTLVLIESASAPRARGKGVVIALHVAGVDAYRDALVARGIRAAVPRDVDGSRSFTVRDPDGYWWRFTQNGA